MATYSTTTSLQVLMIGTTFDTATTSLASKMLTKAENEINKYLSKRYDVGAFNTSTSVPPIVTSLCDDLAAGYSYLYMGRGGKDSMDRADSFIKPALENLKMLSEYKSNLINSSGGVISDISNTGYQVKSTTSDYSNTFNEDDQINWTVDDDKLDAIDTERES